MKREKTLRQNLIFFLFLAFLVPMLCFAIISQIRIWKVVNANIEESIENDVRGMNTTLDLVLDKYATVLYDFCTDEDVIHLVEHINKKQDVLDTNSSQIRRELTHICNRHDGVEGITLITDSGRVFFYDRMMASSHTSSWAGLVEAPGIQAGAVYRSARDAIQTDEGNIYLYQISRKLVDYQDINRQIGTVVLSINAETLSQVFSAGESSEAFLCEDGKILASTDDSLLYDDITMVKTGNKMVRSVVNEKSGWTIFDYHSRELYQQALVGQTIAWGALTLLMVVLLGSSVWYLTKPILDKIEGMVQAMNRVEDGDFAVQLSSTGRVPREIRRIVDGFNRMVRQLDKLIAQVKQSALDQKNAEISAMEAQIDPHFLYNTLDTINWKAIEREEYEISSMVGILADILRYSIRNPGETVSVGQALYWMEQYITLQSKKLDAPLEVEVDVPEDIRNCRIHKLLLQPFVENAIRHGFCQKKDVCRLTLNMRRTDDQIHVIIKDNGNGMAPEVVARLNDESVQTPGHVGIDNVRTRLKLYYGEDATVYFESQTGRYTTAHLFIKAKYSEEEQREDSDSGGRGADPQRSGEDASEDSSGV